MNRTPSHLADLWSSVWRALANLAWLTSCLPDYLRFQVATWFPVRAQHGTVRAILARLPADAASGDPARALASRPSTGYDDYRTAIDRIMDGLPHGLTMEPVLLLEPTSGSGSAPKLIPYTPQLRREFQRAINPWIASLYLARPSLLRCSQYWSISPTTPFEPGRKSAVPVGFDTDAAYLSPLQKRLGNAILSVPSAPPYPAGPSSFLYATACRLLRDRHLGLISVWHPSFLLQLTDLIHRRYGEMIDDIAQGRISMPKGEPEPGLDPLPRRATGLHAIDIQQPDAFRRIWPKLCIISCWTDGNAALEIDRVRSLFPGCAIQPKGLIATEAMVSIPIGLHAPGVCTVRSHGLEFIDQESGMAIPIRKLELNKRYRMRVTTGSGFLRYDLGDIVEVTGRYHRTPRIRFIAREGLVSDLVGEKIHAPHAAEIRDQLLRETGGGLAFFMLAPMRAKNRWHYGLFVQTRDPMDSLPTNLAARCDTLLAANYHYAHARQLGQLGTVHLFRIHDSADEVYLAYHTRRGMKRGAIKLEPLHKDSGWETRFQRHSREEPQS